MNNPPLNRNEIAKKNKIILVALFTFSVIPILIAFVIYKFDLITDTKNVGELISPIDSQPQRLTQALTHLPKAKQHKWKILLLPNEAECIDACAKALYNARQLHTLLHRDSHRLIRVMISQQHIHNNVLKDAQDSHLYHIPTPPSLQLPSGVYLADPNNNVILYYSFEDTKHSLLKDIKHLMKTSRIG